jgi:DNA-binding PadR family transcriptional regulator
MSDLSPNSDADAAIALTPAMFHILLSLAVAERHGYGMMQEIAAQTGGRLRMGPGTLYTAIKRMLAAGWIEESAERPDPTLDDQRRRYYRLTELGRQTLRAEAERLAEMVRLAQRARVLGEIEGSIA